MRAIRCCTAVLIGVILIVLSSGSSGAEERSDEAALRETTGQTFEFHLVKRPQIELRVRLPEDKAIGAYTPEELLTHYWKSTHIEEDQREPLIAIAKEVMHSLNEENR